MMWVKKSHISPLLHSMRAWMVKEFPAGSIDFVLLNPSYLCYTALEEKVMELHSKNRFKKVIITDIAIKKVQRISYKGLTEEQNDILYRLSRMVLIKAQQENDSNESAFTVDLDDPDGGIGEINGTEHFVDIDADATSYHLLRVGKKTAIVHNHPSTQTLSIQDIQLFLHFDSVIYIVVVSNQGTVHYLMKDNNYDFCAAEKLRAECCADLKRGVSSADDYYNAALDFLTHCSEVGMFYQ